MNSHSGEENQGRTRREKFDWDRGRVYSKLKSDSNTQADGFCGFNIDVLEEKDICKHA